MCLPHFRILSPFVEFGEFRTCGSMNTLIARQLLVGIFYLIVKYGLSSYLVKTLVE